MFDEGVIKYSCQWEVAEPLEFPALEELMGWRDRIFAAGLIGIYPNGVGYGNISLKLTDSSFVISGTQTGHLPHTEPQHYTLVDSWNIERNSLHCTGPIKASSESLTHAALYTLDPAIRAIVHGHSAALWQQYLNVLPTTRASVPYGTPAMAYEMGRLFREESLAQKPCLVMAGHEDGLLAFGGTLEQAATMLLALKQP
ncbi:MAG: class II aldolase/adducin family protein [Cyanobacteria bacterium Co-bin13]|nr:class II aldolase/adducin family protein [Cyanobacteria bacterium Co-bin13]